MYMKLITPKYISGILTVFAGTLATLTGILLALPPSNSVLFGILLLLAGLIIVRLGFKLTAERVPPESETTLNILHHANLINKKKK